jgi:hypothetical protein
VRGPVADSKNIDAVVQAAREVLKHEWAVTKYGIFTKLVLAIKAFRDIEVRSHPDGSSAAGRKQFAR